MATNLALDDALITEAQRVGHHRTKREAVTQALKEYIQHRKQSEILDLVGKIDFVEGYDYKALRVRR
jgi:Arc/MetJ family transcription regulator